MIQQESLFVMNITKQEKGYSKASMITIVSKIEDNVH